jgi:hypothetical protein
MRIIILALLAMFLYTTTAFAGVFHDNSDGTVTDLTTKLTWQQCSAGQSGTNCATGTAGTYTWQLAINYCEALSLGSFTDWRLPNFRELQSIADLTTYSPAINATYFPATPGTSTATYWSSTTYADDTTAAWVVNFNNGITYGSAVNGAIKTNAKYVRCVRGRSLGSFVRLKGSGKTYTKLQNAYAAAVEGDTIEAQAVNCAEILTLSRNISVVLEGGYDSGFTSNPAFTTVGSLTISRGVVTIENVKIK